MSSKFLVNFFILIGIIFIYPKETNANIYQLKCKNKKNTTTWVYSLKREAVILVNINNNKTVVNFKIKKNTTTSFSSKGVMSRYETTVNWNKKTGELSVRQASLRGSNQFYKCSEPTLLKEE